MTDTSRELSISRVYDAPREKVFRAWTDPDILKRWFAPKPWTTPSATLDVRNGGSSLVVMRSPEGQDFPNPGVYLEVVENERIVSTDAYTAAWTPSEKPFMTLILTFEDQGTAGRCTRRACCTGARRTAGGTRRWASTKAGESAATSSARC